MSSGSAGEAVAPSVEVVAMDTASVATDVVAFSVAVSLVAADVDTSSSVALLQAGDLVFSLALSELEGSWWEALSMQGSVFTCRFDDGPWSELFGPALSSPVQQMITYTDKI